MELAAWAACFFEGGLDFFKPAHSEVDPDRLRTSASLEQRSQRYEALFFQSAHPDFTEEACWQALPAAQRPMQHVPLHSPS